MARLRLVRVNDHELTYLAINSDLNLRREPPPLYCSNTHNIYNRFILLIICTWEIKYQWSNIVYVAVPRTKQRLDKMNNYILYIFGNTHGYLCIFITLVQLCEYRVYSAFYTDLLLMNRPVLDGCIVISELLPKREFWMWPCHRLRCRLGFKISTENRFKI